MPSAKKYKLFSAKSEDGSVPLCAFFASDAGCRNGDGCKFKHALPRASPHAVVPSSSSSAVSSESENEMVETNNIVFAQPGEIVVKKGQGKNDNKQKKNKKKRKSLEGSEDIFANPKNQTVKTQTPEPKQKKQKASNPPAKTPGPYIAMADAAVKLQQPPSSIKKAKNGTPSPKRKPKAQKQADVPSFRKLNLPIASFSLPSESDKKSTPKKSESFADTSDLSVQSTTPDLPIPKSTPTGLKWQDAVLKSRDHERYDSSFSFEKFKEIDENMAFGTAADWIKARPFGSWCANNPQAIAVDCEMCETQDPVSGVRNPKALCRVSIVNADKPDEVLLDSLVKPAWPVKDYRTWVNGIKKEDLENVQFTLRHAQAFLMALCSEETVIIGHALHNDLAALQMEHHCNVDSALLFTVKDSPDSSPSLKDLAKSELDQDMPTKHDSVNDARTSLLCLESYLKCDGNVKPVVRSAKANRNHGYQLFVHRVPKVCQPSHLSSMFLTHTSVQPTAVSDIEFSGESGKTLVSFQSTRHANLAFDTLEGNEEADKSGRMQKKVFLRNGDYVRVRKMTYPKIQTPVS